MAVTLAITQLDDMAWRLGIASTVAPPVDLFVYVDGVLVQTVRSVTGTGEVVLAIEPGTDPYVEVTDRVAQRPKLAFPGNVEIVWDVVEGAEGAERYRVEEKVAGDWVVRTSVPASGQASYRYRTRWLPDGGGWGGPALDSEFRVIATDAAGNDSVASLRTVRQVRHPPAPSVTYTYSAGTGKVTIS